jgi:hypothetical protein
MRSMRLLQSVAGRRACTAALLTAVVLLSGPAVAVAQEATLALSRDVALWNDSVEARIQARGCTGPASLAVNPGGAFGLIEISLAGCADGSAAAFSGSVQLGPLYPGEYTVRLLDGRGGRPALASDTLTVHPEASLDVEMPAAAPDNAPVTLVLTGPASTNCFTLGGPTVNGHVIEITFEDLCPFEPPGGPHIFREEVEVGPLPAGEYEVRFFDHSFNRYTVPDLHRETLIIRPALFCLPSDTALCLQNGRFRVEAHWQDFAGNQGVGHPIDLPGGIDDSGLLWFFSPGNVELTVKVINACTGASGHWWVFISSGSTVAYTVTITDTLTGRRQEYTHPAGSFAPLIADTAAFSCP